MKFVKRKQVKKINLPGRIIQKVIGKDSFIKSDKMTMGFAYYSAESGVMQPHHHATVGLPIIRTSVDHGVAYGKADERRASEQSMTEAIKMAIDFANAS